MRAFVVLNYYVTQKNEFPNRLLLALAEVDLAWITDERAPVPQFWKNANLDCDSWRKQYMALEPLNMELARRTLLRGYNHDEINTHVRNFVHHITALPTTSVDY